MTDLVALKAANEKRWAQAKLLKPGSFNAVAKHLVDPSAKARPRKAALVENLTERGIGATPYRADIE
jgi:hypothetical protein